MRAAILKIVYASLLLLAVPAFAASPSAVTAARLMRVLNSPEGEKQYFGAKVSIEAKHALVPDILRLVGHSSGLNVIWDPDVETQKVSVSVKDVPWDQLLDIVLSQRGLKVIVSGNVVRIMTSEAFRRSLREAKESLRLSNQLDPTVMVVIPVDNASAAELKKLIEAVQ